MQERKDRKEGIQDWRDAGQEEYRTGEIRDRRNAGPEGCRTGVIKDRRDAGQEGCRTGGGINSYRPPGLSVAGAVVQDIWYAYCMVAGATLFGWSWSPFLVRRWLLLQLQLLLLLYCKYFIFTGP